MTRTYNNKKNYRKKRTYNKKKTNIPRPKIYPFRRVDQYQLDLGNPTEGWITTLDNAVVKTFSFTLNQLTNYTEFSNLFESYKLNYAVIKMYPAVNSTDSINTTGQIGGNMIISVWPANHGQELTAAFSIGDLNQIQRKRQFLMPARQPTVVKMPLKQLGLRYGPTTIPPSTVDYAHVKPKYVNTQEPSTVHYGVNVHIQSATGTGFVSSYDNFLMIQQQVLLTCKQVK